MPPVQTPPDILNVAHRGGEDSFSENTFAAFDGALSLGTRWVESDLRLSRDGEIVLIHDAYVDRTTDGDGAVSDMSVAELKQLDAGSWFDRAFQGERIPTLAEFFQRYRGARNALLEVKDAGLVEERLTYLISQLDVHESVIIIGFDRESLEKIKSMDNRIQIGWTALDPSDENVEAALEMRCHHIGIRPRNIIRETVDRIQGRGLPVRSTTIPDEGEMRRVISCGVIGMTINFPHLLTAYCKSLAAS